MSMRYSLIVAISLGLIMTPGKAQDSLWLSLNDRSSLTDSTFNQGNIQDIYQLVRGQAAGAFMSKPGSNPTEGYQVRLRGINTLSGRSNPLVVIDGIPSNMLNLIDPMDIERIEVLRGAQTARYGMQGGSGVIEITTKSGGTAPLNIRYNTFASLDAKIQNQRMLDPGGFIVTITQM